MYWFFIGAILVNGSVLALAGILYVAKDLMQVVDESTNAVPENWSNAVDLPVKLESL